MFFNQRKLNIETTPKRENAHKELSMITINPHPKNPTNTQTKDKQTLTYYIHSQEQRKDRARDILND